jgi:hypothetical protein
MEDLLSYIYGEGSKISIPSKMWIFEKMCVEGNLECMKALTRHPDASSYFSSEKAMQIAIAHGHRHIIDYIVLSYDICIVKPGETLDDLRKIQMMFANVYNFIKYTPPPAEATAMESTSPSPSPSTATSTSFYVFGKSYPQVSNINAIEEELRPNIRLSASIGLDEDDCDDIYKNMVVRNGLLNTRQKVSALSWILADTGHNSGSNISFWKNIAFWKNMVCGQHTTRVDDAIKEIIAAQVKTWTAENAPAQLNFLFHSTKMVAFMTNKRFFHDHVMDKIASFVTAEMPFQENFQKIMFHYNMVDYFRKSIGWKTPCMRKLIYDDEYSNENKKVMFREAAQKLNVDYLAKVFFSQPIPEFILDTFFEIGGKVPEPMIEPFLKMINDAKKKEAFRKKITESFIPVCLKRPRPTTAADDDTGEEKRHKCPICFEFFNDNDRREYVSISCMHVICKECLGQLESISSSSSSSSSSSRVKCPTCRSTVDEFRTIYR